MILLAHEPIDAAEGQDPKGEPYDRHGRQRREVYDDKFPRQGEQRDEDHGSQLNDALFTMENTEDRVVELHGDQHRHDHAEDALKNLVVDGGQAAEEEVSRDGPNQMKDGDDDDAADEQGQEQRHNLFEAGVKTEVAPIVCGLRQPPKTTPVQICLGSDMIDHSMLNPVAMVEGIGQLGVEAAIRRLVRPRCPRGPPSL